MEGYRTSKASGVSTGWPNKGTKLRDERWNEEPRLVVDPRPTWSNDRSLDSKYNPPIRVLGSDPGFKSALRTRTRTTTLTESGQKPWRPAASTDDTRLHSAEVAALPAEVQVWEKSVT